jgi:hypothetical protein
MNTLPTSWQLSSRACFFGRGYCLFLSRLDRRRPNKTKHHLTSNTPVFRRANKWHFISYKYGVDAKNHHHDEDDDDNYDMTQMMTVAAAMIPLVG